MHFLRINKFISRQAKLCMSEVDFENIYPHVDELLFKHPTNQKHASGLVKSMMPILVIQMSHWKISPFLRRRRYTFQAALSKVERG
jgi:hypothetical protein